MADLALVLLLSGSVVITCIAMVLILKSWWQNRLTPSLMYLSAVACFTGMTLDLLLDQIWEPFSSWELVIEGHRIWMSNLLLTFFIVGGFLSWYFAIMYSQYDSPPTRSIIITFLAGAALIGEIESDSWSTLIPLTIEALAFAFLIVEIILYANTVMKTTDEEQKKQVRLYFIGFVLWISAGPIGVVLANIPGSPDILSQVWPVPYGLGLLIISYSVALNPRLLYISAARPLDLMILDKEGTLVFSQRFFEYPNAIDSELMGSAMSGVVGLMKEMLASEERLRRIDHGDVKILVESGTLTTFLLIVTRETSRFRQSLRNAVLEFEANYREELQEDTALITPFMEFGKRAEEVFLDRPTSNDNQ